MEIPDYLLSEFKRKLFFAAFEKIPVVITEIAENEGVRPRPIFLTVSGYTANGMTLSLDHFWLSKQECLRQIERAAEQGYNITIQDETITVRRILPDGKYYIAEYKPTPRAEEKD